MMKKILTAVLAAVMLFSLGIPAFAEEEPLEIPEELLFEEMAAEAETPADPDETVEAEQAGDEEILADEDMIFPEEPEFPDLEDELLLEEQDDELPDDLEEGVFTYVVDEDGWAVITGYTGSETELTIPAFIDDLSVRAIGAGAFKNSEALESVAIADGIEEIREGAFAGCASLMAVALPKSVRFIAPDAFAGSPVVLTCVDNPYAESFALECGISFTALYTMTEQSALKAGDVLINEANFPDAAFLAYVRTFDTDSNGILSEAEIAAVTEITIPAAVADATGIQVFTGLTRVASTATSTAPGSLAKLELYANTKLTYINVSYNQLTVLDVSQNVELKSLYCSRNQLGTLDVTNNTALQILSCSTNQLTNLDISKNTNLNYLICTSNKIAALDISSCPKLVEAYNTTPHSTDTNKTVKYYSVNQNFKAPNLGIDYAVVITAAGTPAADAAINEANFPDAAFRAYVTANFDKDSNGILSGAEITAATQITLPVETVDAKGIEFFTELRQLKSAATSAAKGKLASLNVSHNTKLSTLSVTYNELTSLDVSKNTALTSLYCAANKLTELNVANNTKLVYFYCYSNQLTELDVSNNASLTRLYCFGNKITELNISKCPSLIEATKKHAYADKNKTIKAYSISGESNDYNLYMDYTVKLTTSDSAIDTNIYNFVYRCYSEALGRTAAEIEADKDGVMYWYNNLKNQLISADYVGYYFVFSPEGASKGQSNNAFVTMLYRLYMNRVPDAGGLAYWDDLLNSGTLTRENVNWWFCESAEWQGIKAQYGMK